jgi:hypothetical protein
MKKIIQKSRLAILIALGALTVSACAPPPVLIMNRPLGDRILRFGMQRVTAATAIYVGPAAAQQSQPLFNLLMQVCSLDQNGQPANCRATMVLDRVNPNTIY